MPVSLWIRGDEIDIVNFNVTGSVETGKDFRDLAAIEVFDTDRQGLIYGDDSVSRTNRFLD